MLRRIRNRCLAGVLVTMLAIPESVLACAACSGRSNDGLALGLNAGVLTLLTVLVVILCLFGGFGFYLVRRAAQYPMVLPGHLEGVAK